ncbi:YbhB/YbcL family Raf kinase inhibitor-like protein [Vulcanisaeta thermophila]|uniref:YbhB/YbcL family Raf kinase inhibitor-like protein n=1 Tax=Vulcanisaeta thermophila TaxID=867917 RepID=UPI000852D100|nr:YbhB/YbcL family Raf kinase inhibitor-like protein [Vulcanisaeta thermophila]
MKVRHLVVVILAVIIIVAVALTLTTRPTKQYTTVGLVKLPLNAQRIVVSTTAFTNGSVIPILYTCNGANVSIPISWSNIPPGTKSIVVVMEDLNAPAGPFMHWVVYDIPPNVTSLSQGLPAVASLPGVGYQGINDFGTVGYGGPCPPPGPAHEYVIIVMALDKELPLGPGVPAREVLGSVGVGDVLGYGILIGYYG